MSPISPLPPPPQHTRTTGRSYHGHYLVTLRTERIPGITSAELAACATGNLPVVRSTRITFVPHHIWEAEATPRVVIAGHVAAAQNVAGTIWGEKKPTTSAVLSGLGQAVFQVLGKLPLQGAWGAASHCYPHSCICWIREEEELSGWAGKRKASCLLDNSLGRKRKISWVGLMFTWDWR